MKGQDSWKLHNLGGPKTDATYLHDFDNNGNINPSGWTETVFTTDWDNTKTFPFVADLNNDGVSY